jgi:DNA-binding CsgD family transcriptional regulator
MDLSRHKLWRIIAIICAAFCVIDLIAYPIANPNFVVDAGSFFPGTFVYATLICAAALFGFLVIRPECFMVYTAIFTFFGLSNIIDGGDTVGFMLYALGVGFAFHQGFFRKGGRIKLLVLIALLVGSVLTQLRFPTQEFVTSLMNVAILFIMIFLFIVLFWDQFGELVPLARRRTLDLGQYDFKPRDCEFIKLVLKNAKYEDIAKEFGLSESSIKQNMAKIYKALGVKDRNEFIMAYSQARIISQGETDPAQADERPRSKPEESGESELP